MNSPSKGSYRLLYRGSLSLPDSHLTLDGITFAAQLDAEHNLLENPLALALESMRGRPALRYMGTMNLKDVSMDSSGDISIDIHPQATLSRIYFENTLCLQGDTIETVGVRVALGDTDGPETTQIIIYIRKVLNKEDDPTPRKPPSLPIGRLRELRRAPSSNFPQLKPPSSLTASLGSGVRFGKPQPEFKIPQLPAKVKAKPASKGIGKEKDKDKEQEQEKGDVFGMIEADDVFASNSVATKGSKRKRSDETASEKIDDGASEFERDNKSSIKKATSQQLTLNSLTKAHPEWKGLFNHIYNGVLFALRSELKSRLVDQATIDRLVNMHAGMYLKVQP